jgi:hypothetical protein
MCRHVVWHGYNCVISDGPLSLPLYLLAKLCDTSVACSDIARPDMMTNLPLVFLGPDRLGWQQLVTSITKLFLES